MPIILAIEPDRRQAAQLKAVVRGRLRANLVLADTAGKFPYADEITADFVYVRLHGSEQLYVSGYTDEELDAWAHLIRGWSRRGMDSYTYFDNDAKVYAPRDARNLSEKVRDLLA